MKTMNDFPLVNIINRKFLVPGYTHMESNIDHSMIEKQRKTLKIPVYHTHDWFQLVRGTGLKTSVEDHEMKQEKFIDFAGLFRTGLVVRKKNIDGEQFLWHDVQWLQYRKVSGHVNYKYSHAVASFKTIIGKAPFTEIQQRYNSMVAISADNKKDRRIF
ncbi:hypothetical protein PR048_003392 [Dryococelus australis]|uniref:Uncharacterized protein n=1 Tax=Dryococelus australis TaxID=614101 RepID=A0ABQ9IMY3_9NEOP|nr:hypothetical protein PR048_003392 [Dryococelus australis]